MRYVNHKGAEFDFDARGIYTHRDALRDYAWDVSVMAGRVGSVKRAEASIPVDVSLVMEPSECNWVKAQIREVLDADPLAGRTGRLYDGEWYVECLLKSSAKDAWWYDDGAARIGLTFFAPDPAWIREHVFSVARGDTSGGLNFPFDFPFGFGSPGIGDMLVENEGSEPALLKLAVYGPARNPGVVVGGNRYEVACEVPAGGRLIIDGPNRAITLEDAYGRKENVFSARRGVQREGSGSYVFQRVGHGYHAVSWDGSFAFDATVYERRSESGWGA